MMRYLHATIIKIGNSRGIRIPKPVIEQCGFHTEVEIEVHDHHLIIRSVDHPRAAWSTSFAGMSEYGDDKLLEQVAEPGPNWDTEEWEW
ncbi:MAG: AbrB/MazE/SpoVT family DNA-binding domain-containing protein [Candidatus Sabulitectum sp.]|nr:AbrB/MazE/SpoVT family DNA-binding domain-containing protein [Candidatus Sabulitectum sp.]